MARRASSFRRGPRRATDWGASSVATAFTGVSGSTVALLETFTPIIGGETLIRTRGLLTIMSDQVTTQERQMGAVGIAVVTAQAESVGITAIPHPDTDAAWGGWLWHTYFARQMEFVTGAGFDPNWVQNIVIDSKAMRKVDEDERIVVVVENSSPHGMLINTSMRVLSKVH